MSDICAMESKEEIVSDWLHRYTGKPAAEFGKFILLTNFYKYVSKFAELTGAQVEGKDVVMPSATHDGISIIDFGIGSPNAALIMDLLMAVQPEAVLFLGKCGGLKKRNQIGDFILPIGAIRGDGTSDDYLPKEVPALPSFALQRAISSTIKDSGYSYWTGTVFTTNRRVWEHDKKFKAHLKRVRAYAIDMETATLFTVGFHNKIPTGALLLVTDQPMVPEGVKSMATDAENKARYDANHVQLGINSLKQIKDKGETIRHLKF